MRHLMTAATILGLAATAFAGPKAPAKHSAKMTAAQCSAACNKMMKAKGMSGSCSIAMCKSGKCPHMAMAPKGKAKGKMQGKMTHKM